MKSLQILGLLVALTLFAGLAVIATPMTFEIAQADSPFKDSPSDDNNGGGNDPPNNKNHRGNN